jgi:hypothetical protein
MCGLVADPAERAVKIKDAEAQGDTERLQVTS